MFLKIFSVLFMKEKWKMKMVIPLTLTGKGSWRTAHCWWRCSTAPLSEKRRGRTVLLWWSQHELEAQFRHCKILWAVSQKTAGHPQGIGRAHKYPSRCMQAPLGMCLSRRKKEHYSGLQNLCSTLEGNKTFKTYQL